MLRSSRISALPGEAFRPVSETFGERLRRLREEQGFSITELAGAVGVTDSAIRQLEIGNVKSPGFALGLRIADRLHVDPYYLALGAGLSLTEHIERIEKRVTKLEQRVATIPATRR
jgi:transcriptional regulator with XRE-family HTH domain